MRDVRKNEHNAAWQALLERKLAGDKITTEDFDAILGNFAVHPLPFHSLYRHHFFPPLPQI